MKQKLEAVKFWIDLEELTVLVGSKNVHDCVYRLCRSSASLLLTTQAPERCMLPIHECRRANVFKASTRKEANPRQASPLCLDLGCHSLPYPAACHPSQRNDQASSEVCFALYPWGAVPS